MSHVTSGDRAYLTDSDSYGEVSRTTFLGLKNASVITMDDGTVSAFSGENVLEKVVSKASGKNGKGNDIELPVDVKEVGPELLGEIGVSDEDQLSLFEKFMALPKTTRRSKLNEWVLVKDDESQKSEFLSTMVGELVDDEIYIKAQAALVLNHLDDDIRTKMLGVFMETTTDSQRREMILTWHNVKSDKKNKDTFLQTIYALTMTDDEYINVEYMKILDERGLAVEKQESIMKNYFENMSDTAKEYQVTMWRKNHRRSKKIRINRARWLIRVFS